MHAERLKLLELDNLHLRMVPLYIHAAAEYISPINPLTGTLKPQSNEPLYSSTVIGTLAVYWWAVTFGTARRGLGGAAARLGPSSLYQM